jgi:superfamily II DNA or RNA helicase
MKARDYQEAAVEAIFEEWKEVRSTLGVAATGLGKTFIMTESVKRSGQRAIMLAHRSELIFQARRAFMSRGIECEIEKAEMAASTSLFNQAPVVLATVQTLGSGEPDKKRMQRFNPMDFGLLLYDESHHSVSKGNKAIVDYFMNGNPALKVLGVTATPDRADEAALGQIFESVAFEYDILFGVDNGWLIEPEQQFVSLGSLDFSHMRTTAGDLNGADLAAAMEAEENVQGVVQPTLEAVFRMAPNSLMDIPHEHWGERLCASSDPRRTIVFTASVAQAEMLSNIFNRVIPNVSKWVCGKTSDIERRETFASFDDGRTAILVNCGVTTEGYDNPAVEIIVVARPTKSRSLYAQMIGRGTRPLPGIVDGLDTKEQRIEAIRRSDKPAMLVMDFVGNSGRHKLITTADILGGKASDEALEAAVERVKKEKTKMTMREVIEEEEERIKTEAERRRAMEEARKQKLVAKVQYSATKINPFSVFELSPIRERGWDSEKSLSEKQRGILMKQGIDPATLSYSQGKQLLNEMFRRWSSKLATMKQCNQIKRFYPEVDVKNLSMKRASAIMDALAKNRWKRVDISAITTP